MPYADKEKQREAQKRWAAKKHAENEAWRKARQEKELERYHEKAQDPNWRAEQVRRVQAHNEKIGHEKAVQLSRQRNQKHSAKKKATVVGEAAHAVEGLVTLS